MSKSRVIIALLFGTLVIFSFKPVLSAEYEVSYMAEFYLDEFVFDKNMGYDVVFLKNGDCVNEVGEPMLPSKALRIALPAGMEVKSVRVTDTEVMELSGEFDIFPSQPPRKIGPNDKNIDFVEPNKRAYASNQPYPEKIVELVHQSDLAGQGIAHIVIHPMQYVPAEKKLKFYTSIALVLEGVGGYECKDYLSPGISDKGRETYLRMIKGMVQNPEEVKLESAFKIRSSTTQLPEGPFDHVVITSSTYASYFEPLVYWHTKKGIKDTVIDKDWIYANYSGASNQEKIRNFVIDANSSWGTTYFLLGGENETIPFEYRNYDEGNTPSDQYYSDFDDDWTHEVFVGRASVGSTSEVNTFVNKVLKYEKDPLRTDYPLDVLLVGMDLDASTHCEELKNTIDSYIPSQFNVTTVYDSDGGSHRTAVISALNSGQNLVNHADHSYINYMGTGDYNHGLGIYNQDVDNLNNNDQTSVVVSTGCDPNYMDNNDCIAEHFVIYNPNQAGVAFTGNTRSGLYYGGDPYSLSNMLDREWWRGLFTRDAYKLGDVLVDSKHNFPTGTNNVRRHCEWTFNLLGEPEMPIWTDSPDSLAVSFPDKIPIGSSQFIIYVEDSTTHSPVSQAYICLWKENEVYLTGFTNFNGYMTFFPSPATHGTMYVTVTKQNYLPYESEATVASPLVFTQPATEVEETSATIHGFLEDDFGLETTCWLAWDTDSGEPYADIESLGVKGSGQEFEIELTSLTQGELYYFVAKAQNDAGWSSGEELKLLTKPLPPAELTAEATSCSTVYLSWTKPPLVEKTMIERNHTPAWTRGEGTEIYNDTSSHFQDSGLEPESLFYYQAWSLCEKEELFQYSDDYDQADAVTLFMCGDVNGDKRIDLSDVIHLANYYLKGGDPPQEPICRGNGNGDEAINLSDVIFIANYYLSGGDPPHDCENYVPAVSKQ